MMKLSFKENDIIATLFLVMIIYMVSMCVASQGVNNREHFKLFEQRYDLRGFPLYTSDIKWKFIYPESHWRLNNSSGVMYESRWPPHKHEGPLKQGACPHIFDRDDATCWWCDKSKKQ